MKTHTIHWKSKTSGRMGAGTRLMEQEEAEHLAQELNQDYPDIQHQAVATAAVQPLAELATAMV